jgi:hypothetical protein
MRTSNKSQTVSDRLLNLTNRVSEKMIMISGAFCKSNEVSERARSGGGKSEHFQKTLFYISSFSVLMICGGDSGGDSGDD